jgi:hypothetical protein
MHAVFYARPSLSQRLYHRPARRLISEDSPAHILRKHLVTLCTGPGHTKREAKLVLHIFISTFLDSDGKAKYFELKSRKLCFNVSQPVCYEVTHGDVLARNNSVASLPVFHSQLVEW